MAKKKKKLGAQGRVLLIVFILVAIVFYQMSIVLLIGMMPTIAARLVDKSPDGTRVLTIGFMNFAGCFPYIFDVLQKKGDMATLGNVLFNPLSIVIMYAAAGLGALIEWGIVGFVAGLMVQKGRGRLVDIKKAQEALVKKWGPEVMAEKGYEHGAPVNEED